jgi:signal transduction histidine kinase
MNALFSTTFMPHGTCYLWNTGLVSVEVISNLLIGLAYLAITITLLYLVRKTRDIPFEWMYVAFATFIVTCGITHFFDVLVIWIPAYWSDASVRVVTAFASVGTAFLLPPLIPKAIALADSAALAHDRGIEVEKANRELCTLLNKTQELEQQKTQFFANISHELRTPLALILGPAEKLLASATLDPGHRADLQIIESNGQSLLNLVNDLLDISKIEAGKMQPDYAETDVARLLRTVAANFDGLAKERQMEYKVDAAASTSAEVDPDKLQRIVLNLLSNAFKFTPAGGRVRLTAHGTPEGLLRLEVADSGPGIPPDQRELIFERFRQLDGGATRHFGGTGLGLAISREFAVLLGGRLWVESAEEGGAMFVLEMPLKAAADVPVGRTPLNGPAENNRLALRPIGEPRAGARSIAGLEQGDSPLALVIEDNPELLGVGLFVWHKETHAAAEPTSLAMVAWRAANNAAASRRPCWVSW